MTPADLIRAFETLADAPDGVARLRELVLQLAVRGKLVPQDPSDEPASQLVERVHRERARAVASGAVPRPRVLPERPIAVSPFELPPRWTCVLLDDISLYIQRGKSPKYDDSGVVRVVSQKCVQWSGFSLDRSRGIQQASVDAYGPERFLRGGDLLWNSTGTGTVGRVCVYPEDATNQVVADSHVTVVRLGEGIVSEFIFCWLASPEVQRAIESMTSGTTNQQELNTSTVRAQMCPLPPLAEQHRIVARVDELMGLLDRLEAARTSRDATRVAMRDGALAALRDAEDAEAVEIAWARVAERMEDLFTDPADVSPLRQTILQLAVRGRLVPQDPRDEPASELLKRIASEKARMVKAGKLRKQEESASVSVEEAPFGIPVGWAWAHLQAVAARVTDGDHQPPPRAEGVIHDPVTEAA